MAEDKKERQLDALLDSFLAAYSAAEPRPGLEIRIRAGLKAHAAHERRRWILLLGTSAAMVVLVAVMITAHTSKPGVVNDITAGATPVDPVPAARTTAPSTLAKATRRVANGRPSTRKNARNELLLQVANANLVFEREKLYLTPEPQPAPEPAAEPQTSAPSIYIQELGIPTIEIKDLPSARGGTDSKGSL